MTTLMSHNNSQSRKQGGFVRNARLEMTPKRRSEVQLERIVFGMVVCLTAMACWTTIDTLPQLMMAGEVLHGAG
ncbi:hypothetical protein [Parvularcula dongshanensis]|uniref:Uncharacterized protein n=1 Tax=Parvularcula dongshanensis TaxID=1173995 RepID=A0A840I583_9PROT|nr:hypothetical protein [Parvularcula dongshanensis]MBB4659485.1 hypothetical protein [Parvularcula dongshanensis]